MAVMAVLALLVAGYAAAILFIPGFGPPFLNDVRAARPLALYSHLGGGILALALGPWQFSNRLRQRALRVHRWTGRGYVLAVLFGGVGGVALARHSLYGMVTHVGFGLLGVSWLFTTLAAYVSIRARNRVAHRRWMIRSFALTLAAVTLRIYLPLSAVAGIPFPDAYQAISWLCWVPNLIVAEWAFVRPSGDRRSGDLASAI